MRKIFTFHLNSRFLVKMFDLKKEMKLIPFPPATHKKQAPPRISAIVQSPLFFIFLKRISPQLKGGNIML